MAYSVERVGLNHIKLFTQSEAPRSPVHRGRAVDGGVRSWPWGPEAAGAGEGARGGGRRSQRRARRADRAIQRIARRRRQRVVRIVGHLLRAAAQPGALRHLLFGGPRVSAPADVAW